MDPESRIRGCLLFALVLILVPACADGPRTQPDAGADTSQPEDGPAKVRLSDSLPGDERDTLQVVGPSGTADGTLEVPTDLKSPARFVAARVPKGPVRYVGIVPPGHSGDYEIGTKSTALGVSFLRIAMGGFTPETQRRLLGRMRGHPKFTELQRAIEKQAKNNPKTSPFAPSNDRVHRLANQIVEDVLKPSYSGGGASNSRNQNLKIGDYCVGDDRLSCRPEECRGGESGITEVEKGVKYCLDKPKKELLITNPKTTYYGIETVKPNGEVRDTTLVQAKGGLVEGFALGPVPSDIRARPCDQVTVCQDFTKIHKVDDGDPCALGAGANAVKALGLAFGVIVTGSDLLPGGKNVKKFANLLRKYRDEVLDSRKGQAVMTLFAIASIALEEIDLESERVYINVPNGPSIGPVDVDDLQAFMRFVVDMGALLGVGPTRQDARRAEDMGSWKKLVDDMVSARPKRSGSGGMMKGAKRMIAVLASRAKQVTKSRVSNIARNEKINAKTITGVVGAVGLVGLVNEMRDGEFDFQQFARLTGMAMQKAKDIGIELGITLGANAADALAVSLMSVVLGSSGAGLAWQLGNKVVPFIHDLTVGGFTKETFTVAPNDGGTCAPSCAERCKSKGRSCGTISGCPTGACGSCSGGDVCSSDGACVAPLKTCRAAKKRFETILKQRPKVGVTDMVSGIEPIASRLQDGSRASKEFGELAKCVLSKCRNSSFPRNCYRQAVTGGGACHGICTEHSDPGANCTVGAFKTQKDADSCSGSGEAVYRCLGKPNSDATYWKRLGCQCAASGTKQGVCGFGYRSSAGSNCTTPGTYTKDEEACGGGDGLDNDCDGQTDEASNCNCTQSTYYPDQDGDGYGTASGAVRGCSAPSHGSNWVQKKGDCRDGDPEVYPGHGEYCDGLDNDCDGQTDENCDSDGDGYCKSSRRRIGSPSVCPKGGGDCNDSDGSIHPGAAPKCDGIDNDCDGLVDEKAPLPSKSASFIHSASEKSSWGDDVKRVVSTPTDEGVCAAFLDHSGAIHFSHAKPDGASTTHTETISGNNPVELLEMAWSGTQCAVIYRRHVNLTPDDDLYLARWNPDRSYEYEQVQLTSNTYNSTGDAGITGLEYISGEGWVAGYVETHVTKDDLQVAIVRESFGSDATVRKTEIAKLNVDPLGPWPSIDIGPSPKAWESYGVAVASRWGAQYQIRVYTGDGTTVNRHPGLDIPYPNAKQYARVQLDWIGSKGVLSFHDRKAGVWRVRTIPKRTTSPSYAATGAVSTGSRSKRPPTNLIGGDGTVGVWAVDPRDDEAKTVDLSGSSVQFSAQSHPEFGPGDDLQTVFASDKNDRVYVYSLTSSSPYRTEMSAYGCY